jgi:hypothetical protein
MTKADWLALAGYFCLTCGLASFWPKHAISIVFLCVGIVCVRLARAAASPRKSLEIRRWRQNSETE